MHEGKEVDQGVGEGENDRRGDDEGELLEEYDLASEQEDPTAEGSHGSAKNTDPHGRDRVRRPVVANFGGRVHVVGSQMYHIVHGEANDDYHSDGL